MQESLASPRRITVTPEYLEERMRRRAEWEKANKNKISSNLDNES